jgi:hypothetical protein
MKATVESVKVDTLADFDLPEVSVKFTAAEWQLIRRFVRIAKEHMEITELELPTKDQLVYKKMVPFFMEIDEQVTKALNKIQSEHENVNMDIVRDFHRYDWTEELSKNVATDEEIAAMRKEEEEEAAAQAALASSVQQPPSNIP